MQHLLGIKLIKYGNNNKKILLMERLNQVILTQLLLLNLQMKMRVDMVSSHLLLLSLYLLSLVLLHMYCTKSTRVKSKATHS